MFRPARRVYAVALARRLAVLAILASLCDARRFPRQKPRANPRLPELSSGNSNFAATFIHRTVNYLVPNNSVFKSIGPKNQTEHKASHGWWSDARPELIPPTSSAVVHTTLRFASIIAPPQFGTGKGGKRLSETSARDFRVGSLHMSHSYNGYPNIARYISINSASKNSPDPPSYTE